MQCNIIYMQYIIYKYSNVCYVSFLTCSNFSFPCQRSFSFPMIRWVMMQVPVSKHSAFLRPRFRGPWRNRFAGLHDDHFLRILELNEVRSKKCHVIRVVFGLVFRWVSCPLPILVMVDMVRKLSFWGLGNACFPLTMLRGRGTNSEQLYIHTSLFLRVVETNRCHCGCYKTKHQLILSLQKNAVIDFQTNNNLHHSKPKPFKEKTYSIFMYLLQ